VTLAHQTASDGTVSLKLTLEGSGRHTIALRTDNLTVAQPVRQVDLPPGKPQTLTIQAKMTSVDAPWVAVVVVDGDPAQRKEATGRAGG
jgi:hypothetical protein